MRNTLTIVTVLLSSLVWGQNLVRNPSFEPSECPATGSTLYQNVGPWDDIYGTPDHYGPCTFPGSATTNNNIPPRTGDGNMGLYVYGTFGSGRFNREYVTGELVNTLVDGQLYRVSYYVHPVIVTPVNTDAFINGPGVLFHSTKRGLDYSDNTWAILSDNSIYPEDVIDDMNNWTLVCLYYRATGDERYLTLGTFRPDAEVDAEDFASATPDNGYYLIDDVSVVAVDDPVLEPVAEICPDGEITLTVPSGLQGMWDDGSTETSRTITQPGQYYYGYPDGPCYRIDPVDVQLVNCTKCNVYCATAFTPNGDGTNDEWKPLFECDAIEYKLEIYDRLGNLRFQTTTPDAGWMPNSNVPEGVYIAHMRMTYELYGERTIVEKTSEITVLH